VTALRALCTAVAVVSISAGCGVATSDDVEVADAEDVPFGLLEPDRVPVALRPVNGAAVVQLYLFDPDSSALVPVTRQVSAAGIEAVAAELEAGPTASESFLGLRSALSDIDAIEGADIDGSTALVDLGDSFTTLGGSDQIIAIAQLVYTVTERPNLDRLVVSVNGENVEVPRDDGTLTRDPLTRTDYRSFSPP
jgi:spore germination protein GerM